MKNLHWGHGIIALFLVFAAIIFVLVWVSMNTKVELVTDNYYEKELQYQKQINTIKNSDALEKKVNVVQNDSSIIFTFPNIASIQKYSGEIFLFRPSDQASDFKIPVKLDSTYSQKISTISRQKGMWKSKISWAANGTEYYYEQPIVIQ
jgi:nitrogen fixation protein FixH